MNACLSVAPVRRELTIFTQSKVGTATRENRGPLLCSFSAQSVRLEDRG